MHENMKQMCDDTHPLFLQQDACWHQRLTKYKEKNIIIKWVIIIKQLDLNIFLS